MKEQIKSEFAGSLNDVHFNCESRYYNCRGIIQEIEERLEIDIYDEDFVVFINHVLDEFDHNARYVESNCDAQAIVSDYIINVMTNDIDFDYEYKRSPRSSPWRADPWRGRGFPGSWIREAPGESERSDGSPPPPRQWGRPS